MMAIIGMTALGVVGMLFLIAAFVMLQMIWAFGNSSGEGIVAAVFVAIGFGLLYLCYAYSPIELTVKHRTAANIVSLSNIG
jgi:Kef-type K+ transport system membrane component KefB